MSVRKGLESALGRRCATGPGSRLAGSSRTGRSGDPPRRMRRQGRASAIAAVALPLFIFAACSSSGPVAVKVRRSASPTGPTTTAAPTTSPTSVASIPAVPTSGAPTSATSTPARTTAPPTTATPAPAAPPSTLPLAGAGGLIAGHVTAVGDSVMLDYAANLQADVPGVDVEAAVSRQWAEGEVVLQQLRSEGRLGAVVVVALGTNGPISDADFDAMMSILTGASRVVFVTIVVGQPWEDSNNAVLRSGVARYPNTVLADWNALESQHPDWVYSDGTHLPIGGAGAQSLAALVASEV